VPSNNFRENTLSEHDTAIRLLPESLFSACNVVLFEDDRTADELFPLSVLRPSWEIRCGAGNLRTWLSSLKLPAMSLLMRPRAELQSMAQQLAGRGDDPPDPDLDTLFINGRVIGIWRNEGHNDEFPDTVADADGRILVARRTGEQARKLLSLLGNDLAASLVQDLDVPSMPAGWTVLHARYVWDYMLHNQQVLERQLLTGNRTTHELLGAHALRELPAGVLSTDRASGHLIFVGSGVRLHPGVIFGNHTGPIWIGAQTEVEPHTYLEGPLYVGPNCRIKAGTRFYHGCALGPHCRVAGELSSSILQGFVNKQHEGFLGNSILGSWVNLGADTRTSNLRNDYSEVKVQVGSKVVRSGEQFIGLMAGDHTKTGINTMFNTGTVVGVGANVYGAGYPPRFVDSFMWGGAEGMKPGSIERTLAAARMAMPRRGQELTVIEEELLRRHYTKTANRETRL
jgi:UDP-N-acetylglucosamine diphosphorylase/glucosamine-1-phosphate N-acetyltransferase